MINFKELGSEDFEKYRKIFIEDYSEDLLLNHGYKINESIKIAESSFQSSFPNNVPVSTDKIVRIVTASSTVGYLWYSINKSNSKAYICDFFIFEEYRSKGYGKSAINVLESELSKQSISYLSLRVAYNNPRALALYKSVGFNISGYNMSKRVISSCSER
jgi:ribosomal protein S18 acetylase RimI-like enzyme